MSRSDRTGDIIAAFCLTVGTALFFIGREALKSIAQGTYILPPGYTWVARAELHDRQTTVGMRLVIAGIVIAVASAGFHAWKKRRISQ
ncbi:MAG: hypothetical protein ABIT38_16895 [Gemmatimonadaceae bacterium]